MVRAAQKDDLKNPSAAVKKAAKTMKKKDVKDFAGTKHKGLPEKVKETVQNVVMEKYRAKTVQQMLNEEYLDSDEWTLNPGDRVVFNLQGMESEFEDVDEGDIIKYNGQEATITGEETASEIGDRNYEYYNIQFYDGAEFIGVSGYHLDNI